MDQKGQSKSGRKRKNRKGRRCNSPPVAKEMIVQPPEAENDAGCDGASGTVVDAEDGNDTGSSDNVESVICDNIIDSSEPKVSSPRENSLSTDRKQELNQSSQDCSGGTMEEEQQLGKNVLIFYIKICMG